MSPSKTRIRHLESLPEELLQQIVEYLDGPGLSAFGLTARFCNKLAQAVQWREVVLTDCTRRYNNSIDEDGNVFSGVDQHDDTPMIKKLLVLAKNPSIAQCVQTVIHRCHLPQPAIFHELPRTTFSGMTLSADRRTITLIQLAVRFMTKVNTLRVIFGHPNVTDALLRCLFSKERTRMTPVRRLWLENCRISAGCDLKLLNHALDLPPELDFGGLESIRFRRLPMRAGRPTSKHIPENIFVHARRIDVGATFDLQDGAGGYYAASANSVRAELKVFEDENPESSHDSKIPVRDLFYAGYVFDCETYKDLSRFIELPKELQQTAVQSLQNYVAFGYRGPWMDPSDIEDRRDDIMWKVNRERLPSADVALSVLRNASTTLTSVCLDWILTSPNWHSRSPFKWTTPNSSGWAAWTGLYLNFFEIRFPHLKALQFRNAVVKETMHPGGLYLLDHARVPFQNEESAKNVLGEEYKARLDLACLSFMEYHNSLQCLAWPMDGFFSGDPLDSDITSRVNAVIENLGRNLLDLRVDMLYIGRGERQTDDEPTAVRERRRKFISHFAAKMSRVESIKVEGGIPRDERRELIRALHGCPLQKIVSIGVCSSVGNTWGPQGRELGERLSQVEIESLEGEDKDAIFRTGFTKPIAPPPNFQFYPSYGWPAGPPILHTIASYHADTVRELKFCGYKGAPVLFNPAPICQPILHSLKHFNNLESLIMSVWLSTIFEDAPRDSDIIKYWLDARSPNSTSLVRIVQDEEPEGWERELKTKFAPDALAWQITSFIGPFLSESAKSRPGGIHVRSSMCVGDWGGIFDIDLRIGKGSLNSDICLGYEGPREELEPERRRSKLENRRWF